MTYRIISKKELPKSLVEFEVEIGWDRLQEHEANVVKVLKETMELKGFRKGAAPEAMVRERVGDLAIVEEMADAELRKVYPDLVEKEKIDALARPTVVITKIARENPLLVRITIPVLPKFDMPDYKKIAKGVKLDTVDATDADVEKLIEEIRKNFARQTHSYSPDHNHDEDHKDEDLILPTVDDEFVKKLGDFKDVSDFKVKLKENIKEDKTAKARDKRRAGIAEAILNETQIDVPEILVESEQDKMMGQMEGDITRAGLKVDDYLKHIKKTREELRTSFQADAEKRARLQVIISKIAEIEKVVPDESKVKEQYDQILLAQPEADPMRVKLYVEHVLTNEAVFDFLESQV